MRYSKDGDWHSVARVAGPYHNLLGLVVGGTRTARGGPVVELLPPGPGSGLANLSGGDVLAAAQKGVRVANAQFGTDWQICNLRYLPTDSGPPAIYEELARYIVEQIVAQERSPAGRRQASG